MNIRGNKIRRNCNCNKRVKFEGRGYIWIGKTKEKSRIRWNILENEGTVHVKITFHGAKVVEDKRKSEIWSMRWLQARATTVRRVIQHTIEQNIGKAFISRKPRKNQNFSKTSKNYIKNSIVDYTKRLGDTIFR